jgi:hypothetical protein
MIEGKRSASGTAIAAGGWGTAVTVSGLSFAPSLVIAIFTNVSTSVQYRLAYTYGMWFYFEWRTSDGTPVTGSWTTGSLSSNGFNFVVPGGYLAGTAVTWMAYE